MSDMLKEMKRNSGVSLNESEISQVKTLNAESRLIGAFGNLLRELKWIQADSEGRRHYYGGGTTMNSVEKAEEDRDVDMAKLHKVAMDKLEIVKAEITRTFKSEMKDEKVEKEELFITDNKAYGSGRNTLLRMTYYDGAAWIYADFNSIISGEYNMS